MTDDSELFPALTGWMARTAAAHLLRELFDAVRAGDAPASPRRAILTAFDTVISRLEAAQPLRLAAERKDFQNARTFDDLRIVRSDSSLAACSPPPASYSIPALAAARRSPTSSCARSGSASR